MERAGAIIGLPFSLEGFAFFTEAIFLGIYLYGWDRVNRWAHFAAGVIVAVSGAASGAFVIMVNAWMNSPVGLEAAGAPDGPIAADPVRAMFVLGMAGFFNDLVMPAAWAGTMDVGGRYAGTVSGAMNTMGSIAGAVSVTVVGYLLAWTSGNWTMTFYISAAIYFVGAICWLFLDSHTPIERQIAAMRQAA